MSLDAQKLADLLAAVASFSSALQGRLGTKLDTNATAANSAKLEGKTLAEIQDLIGGEASQQLEALALEFQNFVARTDNPHGVTKEQVGLGNVQNYGVATDADAVAAVATDKYLVASNLAAFWADKVGTAPETLDTIQELAAALQNNPDVITAIQALVGDNAQAIVGIQEALAGKLDAAAQAADSAKLEGLTKDQIIAEAQAGVDLSQVLLKTDDLGANPVALASDTTQEGEGEPVTAEPSTLKEILDRLEVADADLNDRIDSEVSALGQAIGAETLAREAAISNLGSTIDQTIQGVQQDVSDLSDLVNGNKQEIDGRLDAIEATLPNKLEATSNLDTNVVTFPDGEDEDAQQALSVVLAQLKAGIDAAGSDAALQALQQAFNNFVAAKASTAEVIAGEDDTKYTTSAGVKAAVQAAIDALVGAAPEALDTINELAEALQNDPQIINTLMSQIGSKLDATAQAADSAKLEGKSIADLTASDADVAAGTATDKFVTPAALKSKTDAQDLAIAAASSGLDELMIQLAAAFEAGAELLDPEAEEAVPE